MVSIKILSSTTVFNIILNIYISRAPNQHIRMISEESCDTLVMATENAALSSQE